jgi:hypothetical protein
LQFCLNDHSKIAEVRYFFRLKFGELIHTLAVASVFSPPDQELLDLSHQAVYASHYRGDDALIAIDVKCLESVVSMVPYYKITPEGEIEIPDTEHFLVEKMGLDITALFGEDEHGDDDDEQDTITPGDDGC